MVTNNEISARRKRVCVNQKGSPEWKPKEIANYVTWPRTFCINGVDINGNTLKGNT